MTEEKANVNVIYAVAPPVDAQAALSIIIGLSEPALYKMKEANHILDLTEMGIPLKILMFRGKDYDTCAQTIEMFKAKINRPVNEEGEVKLDA